MTDRPPIPIVLVTLPADIRGDVQLAVHHRDWGVEVDIRMAVGGTWTPLALYGGTFETRAA